MWHLPLSKLPNSRLSAVCWFLTRAFISSAVHSSSSICCSLNSFSVSILIPCMLWISGLEVWWPKAGCCLACFDCLCCCACWLVVMHRTVGLMQTRKSLKSILCKEVISEIQIFRNQARYFLKDLFLYLKKSECEMLEEHEKERMD